MGEQPIVAAEFVTADLRKAGNPLVSLSPAVIEHPMNEDDKSAFIAWSEGRPTYQAEDWLTLPAVLRELLPDLFAEHGAPCVGEARPAVSVPSHLAAGRHSLEARR